MGFFDNLYDEAVKAADWTKEAALNVLTVGGHSKLNETRAKYEIQCADLEASERSYREADASFHASMPALNTETRRSAELLQDAKGLVERLSWNAQSSNPLGIGKIQPPSMVSVDRVLSEINTVADSAKGLGVGATAGAGAWFL